MLQAQEYLSHFSVKHGWRSLSGFLWILRGVKMTTGLTRYWHRWPDQPCSSVGTPSGGAPSLSRNTLPPRAMDHPAKAPGVSFATLTVAEPAPISAASSFLSINPWLSLDGDIWLSLTNHPHCLWLTFTPCLLLSSSSQQPVSSPFSLSTDNLVCLPCFSPCMFFFSLCCAPLNPALMHLITSRQSGSSWLIPSRSMPERTALYVTLLSLLQSFVGWFQSWALRLMNMYPGLFSQQFWGSLTKRDERALCDCLLDLTVTFLWSLLPLFIFNRLYPQVRLTAPFECWYCQSSHPKKSSH